MNHCAHRNQRELNKDEAVNSMTRAILGASMASSENRHIHSQLQGANELNTLINAVCICNIAYFSKGRSTPQKLCTVIVALFFAAELGAYRYSWGMDLQNKHPQRKRAIPVNWILEVCYWGNKSDKQLLCHPDSLCIKKCHTPKNSTLNEWNIKLLSTCNSIEILPVYSPEKGVCMSERDE